MKSLSLKIERDSKERKFEHVGKQFIFFLPILYYVRFLEAIALLELKTVNVKNRNIKTNLKLYLATELNLYRKIPHLHF